MGKLDLAIDAFEKGLKLEPRDNRARQKLKQLKSLR